MLILLATPSALTAQIEHGTLDVTVYADPPTVSLLPGASPTVAIPQVNFGDYWLSFRESQATQNGVLISSIAQNGRNGDYATSSVEVERVEGPLFLEYFLPIHRSDSGGGDEINMDAAFAFFPYDEFLGGLTQNPGNGQAFSEIIGSATTGITLGSHFIENAAGSADDPAGAYTLDLRALDPTATPANGILLVSGGKNEDNFALSKANASTFTLFTHDNFVDKDTSERDPIAFVYLPTNKTHRQIPALGRINDNGSASASRGDFTVTKTSTDGRWHLEIPGQSAETGTLIISPEGGAIYNPDNIWSYQWDAGQTHWVIESRDIPGLGLQDTNGEPAFSFAFITNDRLYVNQAATGDNDGSSWENAYTSLRDALDAATPYSQVWVARGTYDPSPTDDIDDTFLLKPRVEVYGGFDGTESLLSERNPRANTTILSGDIENTPNNSSDNSIHVVTLRDHSRLDGFTIADGNAIGHGNLSHGAGAFLSGSESITIANCTFLRNSAAGKGGGLFADSGVAVSLLNCAFKGNQAGSGAGVFLATGASTHSLAANCEFQGNYAAESGGAIHTQRYLKIVNCSLQGNRTSGEGAAIAYDADAGVVQDIHNSILWDNQDGASSGQQYAWLEVNPVNVFTTRVQNGFTSDGKFTTGDPRFAHPVDPADAPTTDGSLVLRATSPFINGGDNNEQVGETDVLGFSRRVDDTIDLGGHESVPTTQNIANIGAKDGSETIVESWIQSSLLQDNSYSLQQVSSSGDIAFDALPTIDEETGALSLTLAPGTTGFATFTLLLDPNDKTQAPQPLDFTVKTAGQFIYVDANAETSDLSGSSWLNAQSSLATALEYSQSGDTIHVAQGNYLPAGTVASGLTDRNATFTLQSGVALYGGFPSGGSDFAQRDPSSHATVLTGGGSAQHIVTGSGTDATAILDGFTIGASNNDNLKGGGALFNDNGSPTIANCSFIGNTTTRNGGAIANINGSSPTITNCYFEDNRGLGGAIANLDGSSLTITDSVFESNGSTDKLAGAIFIEAGNLTLENCIFTDNTGYEGAAIFTRSEAQLDLTDCEFSGNQALFDGGAIIQQLHSTLAITRCKFMSNSAGNLGGAIYIQDLAAKAIEDATVIRDSTFMNNTAGDKGGAINSRGANTLAISNSVFENNRGTLYGGAIYHVNQSLLSVEDSSFRRNSASQGGAIYTQSSDAAITGSLFYENQASERGGAINALGGELTFESSRFNGNRAETMGGAISGGDAIFTAINSSFSGNEASRFRGGAFSCLSQTSLSLLNCTLAGNQADSAQSGGIWMQNLPVQIENSILWENDGQVGGDGGIAPESANNIIQGLPGGFDPLFILDPDPGDGGWENAATNNYGNLRLQPDSPALDAGLNPAEPTILDLGGNPRIQNSTIDLGPYEGFRDDYYHLFGQFEADDDYNKNGYTNWEDYAYGNDPAATHNTQRTARVFTDQGQLKLSLSHRPDRDDVFVQWQASTSLEPDTWIPLEQGTHYSTLNNVDTHGHREVIFYLKDPTEPQIFYRQILSPTQP
ncbi:hypothetical protein VDG1235_2590 [Verrucomicrobiia bacterium DG1235]|nr:hypothetical protein VDG1235_2590 [Verrucomicrobiae bacterium DG1235]